MINLVPEWNGYVVYNKKFIQIHRKQVKSIEATEHKTCLYKTISYIHVYIIDR